MSWVDDVRRRLPDDEMKELAEEALEENRDLLEAVGKDAWKQVLAFLGLHEVEAAEIALIHRATARQLIDYQLDVAENIERAFEDQDELRKRLRGLAGQVARLILPAIMTL